MDLVVAEPQAKLEHEAEPQAEPEHEAEPQAELEPLVYV